MTDSQWVQISYTMVMFASVVVAGYIFRADRQTNLARLDPDTKTAIGLAAFLGAMVGAKLPFVLQFGLQGLLSGTTWFADGKTILAGIFGGYLAVELTKWWWNIRASTGDGFALPVAVAVVLGRLGCFIGGCCFGTPTNLPWGLSFVKAQDSSLTPRHPTQLYEVLFHATWILILLVLRQKHWLVGQQIKAYLLCYLVYRFFSEWLRPEARWDFGLTSYQLACTALFAILSFLWLRDYRFNNQTARG